MYYLIAVLLLLQFFCAIDALERGYSYLFVMFVVLFPFMGAFTYFCIEIIPEFYACYLRHYFQYTLTKIEEDPYVTLAKLQQLVVKQPTIDNQHQLAKQYLEVGQAQHALTLLDKILESPFLNCPFILADKAQALFALSQFQEAKFILEFVLNEQKTMTAKLLYARTLANIGEWQNAVREFEALEQSFCGLEASFYFYHHLLEMNQHSRAKQVLHHMQNRYRRLPSHFQIREKMWLNQAQRIQD
jgi:hypothetical protein